MRTGRPKNKTTSTYSRFSSKYTINTENQCWEWNSGVDKNGYGWMRAFKNHRNFLAHRVSYIIYIGDLNSKDELVCHKCDNPKCVNPFHLFKGTHRDNIHDGQFKGRIKIASHPSQTFYDDGCRCDECKAINSQKNFEKVTMKYRNNDDLRAQLNATKRAYYKRTQQHQVNYRKNRRILGLDK